MDLLGLSKGTPEEAWIHGSAPGNDSGNLGKLGNTLGARERTGTQREPGTPSP